MPALTSHSVLLMHFGTDTSTTTISLPFIQVYPGELVPEETFTHSHLPSSSTIICFLHNFCLSLLVYLEHSTSYSIHFITQSLSSFCNIYPYHHCSTKREIMSCNRSLSLISTWNYIFYLNITVQEQVFT